MGRRPVVGYAEQDAYTSWRRVYSYLQRPGAVRYIKQTTHRRERRQARDRIRKDPHNA
jgi:hypothetical protein